MQYPCFYLSGPFKCLICATRTLSCAQQGYMLSFLTLISSDRSQTELTYQTYQRGPALLEGRSLLTLSL